MAAGVKNTYFARIKLKCPACQAEFKHEDLLTGSGRLNAGLLTDELHRLYLPKREFGELFPLIYAVECCPVCFFSALPNDFRRVKNKALVLVNSAIERSRRLDGISAVVGSPPDLNRPRDLYSGIAAYLAAIFSYEVLPADFCPVFRQAVLSLRCAWLLAHLHNNEPEENFAFAAKILYRKSAFLYMYAMELSEEGSQPLTNDISGGFGPDVDHNFGLDGVIYLTALLQFKYGQATLLAQRQKKISQAKRYLSLLVGSGKVSQRKTSVLLESSRDLFRNIVEELKDNEKNL